MKKLLLFLAAGIFASSIAVSQTSNTRTFSFELEPYFGLRNGVLNEFVYSKNSKTGSEYYLSLLNWNLQNTPYTGISADFAIKDFHIAGDFKALFPNSFGSMDDSDWLQDAGYKTGRTDIKTNYSVHDMELLEGLNAGIKLYYNFHPTSRLTLAPAVSFSYETYSMMGMNGTKYYGKANGSIPGGNTDYSYFSYDDLAHRTVGTFSGNVIKLDREDYYTWIGISLNYKTADSKLNFGISADVSPWTYLISRDSHYLNNGSTGTYYVDLGGDFFSAFRGGIYAQYAVNSILALKLSCDGLFTTEIKGIEYKSNNVNGPYTKNGAVIGSASRYIDFQLSAIIRF